VALSGSAGADAFAGSLPLLGILGIFAKAGEWMERANARTAIRPNTRFTLSRMKFSSAFQSVPAVKRKRECSYLQHPYAQMQALPFEYRHQFSASRSSMQISMDFFRQTE
jgi:hypothetical protein